MPAPEYRRPKKGRGYQHGFVRYDADYLKRLKQTIKTDAHAQAWAHRNRSRDRDRARARARARSRPTHVHEYRSARVVAGVLFALIGIGFLLESVNVWTVNLVYLWPVTLIVIGVSFLLGRARRIQAEETRAAQLAVAEERVRIARELHDIVAHGVSLMTIQIAAARRVARTKPEAADEALEAAEDAGRQSLSELRSLLAVLRSADQTIGAAAGTPATDDPVDTTTNGEAPLTPLPHLADLDDLIDGLRQAGLDVELDSLGTPPKTIQPGIELAAYRVVQESLTNAMRHAGAARVRVSLEYRPERIDIEIDDNGEAAASTPGPVTEGHGLMGMRERVASVGGTLTAGPKLAEPGWRVHASIPLKKAS